MNGRVLKLFGLVAIVLLVLGIAGTAAAAPNTELRQNVGQCFGEAPDAKDEDGSDGWDLYAPDGFVFTDAMVKAGTDCFGDGELYQITGIGTDHVHAEMLCEESSECHEISHFEGMWEEEPPPPVCEETTAVYGEWSEWTVDPQDESQLVRSRSVTFYDANDGTTVCGEAIESEYMVRPVCEWNSELWADDPECQPPPGEAAVADPVPFCGGGIVVNTLANATLTVDSLVITETGSYGLAPGHYVWEAVANEGFEFPEGAVTRGEFDVEDCPRPPRTPPTGGADFLVLPGITAFTLMALVGRRIYKRLKSR